MSADIATVAVRNISKTFAGNCVLSSFALELMPGAIHGLVGQNGSGKSTFVKILSGYHAPDDGGEIWVRGKQLSLPLAPGELQRHGVAFVHQDLALINQLRIVDNLWVGKYPCGAGYRVRDRFLIARSRELLERFGVSVDPRASVGSLSAEERALVAFVRAVIETAEHPQGVIILDEPTARLDQIEVSRLFRAMRAAAERGTSILFISHKLDEILTVTSGITVLREGKTVASIATAGRTEEELIELIVGSRVSNLYPDRAKSTRTSLLSVRGLTGRALRGIDFEVQAGEVLGITGLPGDGFDEVPYALMTEQPWAHGELVMNQRVLNLHRANLRERLALGIAFVPGDRARYGGAITLSVADNLTLPRLSDVARRAFLNARADRRLAMEAVTKYDVRPHNPAMVFGRLSGGNQQKVVLAKWIETSPAVLLMHEPTQGVDIGARKQIFEMIAALARSGKGIVLASMEYEDLAHLANRVLVLRHGRITAELSGGELVKDRVLAECYRT